MRGSQTWAKGVENSEHKGEPKDKSPKENSTKLAQSADITTTNGQRVPPKERRAEPVANGTTLNKFAARQQGSTKFQRSARHTTVALTADPWYQQTQIWTSTSTAKK